MCDLPTVQGYRGLSRDLAFSRFCPVVQGFATCPGILTHYDQGPLYTFPLCGKNEQTTDAMITLWSKPLQAFRSPDHQLF